MSDTVLIVDDSLTVRMDLAEAFEAAGFRTLPCATLAEARELMGRESPVVAVLDVVLPDGDGVSLLEEIRNTRPESSIAVLMLSSEAEVKDRIRGLKMGADEYVGKPYDSGYVVAKARELVQARRAYGPDTLSVPAKVLVIDDSVTFREVLRRALESAGYEVVVSGSGEEGLQIAAAGRIRGVVVDGVLPGVDGATVIRRLRLDGALRDVPCVLLSGSSDRAMELQALDAGADAFVRKDEGIERIVARLTVALRRGADAGTAAAKAATSALGPKKILAVDDSVTYLNELASVLRGERYDVVLAHSGEEALELLAVQRVDCILLDLLMPGIGGEEACRRVKGAPFMRDIPLIVMTTLDEARRDDRDSLGAGAADYIQKSSEFEVLKARVRAQLRRKQFEDENRRIREELLQKELEVQEAKAARELNETKAALIEELERKNDELEAFSYSVSHDLRAPLRGIDGFSQALLEDCADKLDAVGLDHLRRIRANTERMATLIEELLKLSRVGRSELSRERINVSALARSVIDDLRKQEPGRHVDFFVQDGLYADASGPLLKIALENLLGNAWKFTARTPAARVELTTSDLAGAVVYRVRDNGAGFDMSYTEKLFRPFQRLHHQTEFPGTGIGLATVQRIVERHGGRIWADGAVGEGATFSFTLSKRSVTPR